jgi:hypothetical protein
VDAKADKATTYTETEVNNLLNAKADQATTYTETEVDGLIATRTESPDETAITGTATFTNLTNNIALTGIGSIGLEIGDVVQVTGTASNNKLFTVEVITNSGNVIVNQAHAGGTTTKSLVDETVSATVTLVTKWFNAPIGLGQGWCTPDSTRALGVTYTNGTKRTIKVLANSNESNNVIQIKATVGGYALPFLVLNGDTQAPSAEYTIPVGDSYKIEINIPLTAWAELR